LALNRAKEAGRKKMRGLIRSAMQLLLERVSVLEWRGHSLKTGPTLKAIIIKKIY